MKDLYDFIVKMCDQMHADFGGQIRSLTLPEHLFNRLYLEVNAYTKFPPYEEGVVDIILATFNGEIKIRSSR